MKLKLMACVALIATGIVLYGCGGGGNGSTDITGVWQNEAAVLGAPAPKAAGISEWIFHMDGSVVTAQRGATYYVGYQDGGEIYMISQASSGDDDDDAVGDSALIIEPSEVTLTLEGGTLVGERVTGGGTEPLVLAKLGDLSEVLTYTGSLDGTDLSLDSDSAFALRNSGSTVTRNLYHFANGRFFFIEMTVSGEDSLGVGTFPISNWPPCNGEVSMTVYNEEGESDVNGTPLTGTLEITVFTDDRFAGSLQINSFESAEGTATCSFDLPTYVSSLRR